ncbi:hypothetical protein BUALT_Bualt05G0088600 [Buddleja alternifolia]|uniref:Uncharacterized protein n=1 Tax=Buddleja alternifolia TaxID=168488 RepID=A0AAV6XPP0_9LAMI|nr:hypothetical protein BUALT_Bualt05G0088600 [Buddleja alternifolia]
MASLISEALPKFTAETLKLAAKQSQRCNVLPVHLRRAIDNYIQEQDVINMSRKVLSLSQSFNGIKEVNLLLPNTTSTELVEDPLKAMERSQRWKVKTSYGDVGLKYHEDQTVAYVAARMPAVYSALYRVLSEVEMNSQVRRRVPDFSPAKVLDFGAGTGSALWAMMEVWPGSLKEINLVEPSQSMQRAGQSLVRGLEELPHIQSYVSLQSLTKHINKSGRRHDLVIASYVLGEIPSLQDRITLVRQLWDLTGDILVLVEPGTPQGSYIISQMRSHILWMENRRNRKSQNAANKDSKDLMTLETGAFIVAPCPHDGPCPLLNTNKYCHFVQRLERTSSQRLYKNRNQGPLRGYEDEKFSYVAFRRGTRPREAWPLDGMKFDTLKEMKANRVPEDLLLEVEEEDNNEDEEEEGPHADLGNYNYKTHYLTQQCFEKLSYNYYMGVRTAAGAKERPRRRLWGTASGSIGYELMKPGKVVTMKVGKKITRNGRSANYVDVVRVKLKEKITKYQRRKKSWIECKFFLREKKTRGRMRDINAKKAVEGTQISHGKLRR